jgi:3-methyl-2-oxobutanoate hydroxymethyltransferase
VSSQRQDSVRRVSAPEITARKGGEPVVCLTAYTAPMAEILDMMILHGRAVMRGAKRAMVVVDMPFGSYESSPEEAFANAARVMKETGCQAIKLESGPMIAETVAFLVRRGIPVMGHVGLRPQAVNVDGAFRAKGKTEDERLRVLAEAEATADAGAFAVVVEGVAEGLAREITEAIHVPTIGIGASAACDGQILVTDDMLGMFDWTPRFVRRYADLKGEIGSAVGAWAADVRARRFPGEAETYWSKRPVNG